MSTRTSKPPDFSLGDDHAIIPGMDNNTAWIPTLPELLKEALARVGWTQIHFASAMGRDPSDISKILSGKTARPQNETLEDIARVLSQAGLEITRDELIAARDAPRNAYPNPYNYPLHWLRLMNRLMLNSPELVDWFFERWSADYERIITLLERQKRSDE
jgi:transcriptional regulator with XRE-family HTH domain